jgi:hypothetical protein
MSDFDRMTSTSDLSGVGSEQLFAELTPKQAALIQGGARTTTVYQFELQTIHAVQAGADTLSGDDTFVNVDGRKVFGPSGFSTGSYGDVGYRRELQEGYSLTIDLFDEDDFLNGDNDYLGGLTVAVYPTNGTVSQRVSGGGSTYDIYYSIL